VNYTSSLWELLWLQNIQKWEKERTICVHVFSSEQALFLHKFQLSLCTHHIENSDWCAVVDPYAYSSYFYNKENHTYAQFLPDVSWDSITKIIPFPVLPDNGLDTTHLVFSRLDFLDEIITRETFSECIEPLVSHLRHPVAKCLGMEYRWGWPFVALLHNSLEATRYRFSTYRRLGGKRFRG